MSNIFNVLDMMDAQLIATNLHKKWFLEWQLQFYEPQMKMYLASMYKSMPEEMRMNLSKEDRARIERTIGG